jgi:hypothetical protein
MRERIVLLGIAALLFVWLTRWEPVVLPTQAGGFYLVNRITGDVRICSGAEYCSPIPSR